MLKDLTGRMDVYPDPQGAADIRLVPLTHHERPRLILGVGRPSRQAEQDRESED